MKEEVLASSSHESICRREKDHRMVEGRQRGKAYTKELDCSEVLLLFFVNIDVSMT